MKCKFRDADKLKNLRANFLGRPLKKSYGSITCEGAFIDYIDKTDINYRDLEDYVIAFSSETNTNNDLIAARNCLQAYIDRRDEYANIISSMALLVAILTWIKIENSVIVILILFQTIYIWVHKRKDNLRINEANVLITSINIVLEERIKTAQLTIGNFKDEK